MKRKLFVALFVLIMSIGLMACKAEQGGEIAQVSSEVAEEEQAVEESAETDSKSDSGWVMPEIESAQKESDISWYIDEEGIKNELLGIGIKKDNGILDLELDWALNLQSDISSTDLTAYANCFYYDGDFDTYILENELQKDSVNGVEYAYKDDDFFGRELVLGGNGIIVELNIGRSALSEGETYAEYLSRMDFIKPCDEFSLDCLAYFSKDGFFCPASGYCFSIANTEYEMWTAALRCENKEYDAGMSLIDYDAYHGLGSYGKHRESAKKEVDERVESWLEPDEYDTRKVTAIEQSAEYDIGKGHYYGRGAIITSDEDDTESESWYFRSDNTSWTIECGYDRQDEINHENLLGLFEVLE